MYVYMYRNDFSTKLSSGTHGTFKNVTEKSTLYKYYEPHAIHFWFLPIVYDNIVRGEKKKSSVLCVYIFIETSFFVIFYSIFILVNASRIK